MPQRLRIFVSSPADVPDERLRADLIIDKLSQDYSRFFTIESYRWEHEAMLASEHFQDAIEPPSAFDIVVLILWSRLGTPLPEKTAEREYRGIDGRAPVTGTEWEYEEALKAAREKKAPDLLAFRNISPAPIDPRDPDAQAKSIAQLSALNAFWTRHFADRGVFLAAYDEYRTLEEFAQRLEESLRKLIERRIKDMAAGNVAHGTDLARRSIPRPRILRVRACADLLRARRCGDEGDRAACRQRALRACLPVGVGSERLGQVVAGEGRHRAAADEAAAHQRHRVPAPGRVPAGRGGRRCLSSAWRKR